jgi:hypothetical protein
MQKCPTIFCILTALCVVTAAPVQVLANDRASELEKTHQGPHILEVFFGGTYADHDRHDERAFSVGAQYRYAINQRLSVGILTECSDDPFDAWIAGVLLVFNSEETAWQLTVAPGVDLKGSEDEFLFRTGIGYEFEMEGAYSIMPETNVDWVDGETAVVACASCSRRF